ncbi:hypothetical protein K469DRAFT_716276 [Zopfia rhizophila CBS 207.26]|uniref:Uncharacterized protein n=1 Tax=Zopfia rhizophila CBS 207.26 TaxID=1314779 RepID=A0A6A6DNG1_9PEZI|nr:hypothetical protein K469DRAFT_716276 [Zopfia rhizophila CBS 207.26]
MEPRLPSPTLHPSFARNQSLRFRTNSANCCQFTLLPPKAILIASGSQQHRALYRGKTFVNIWARYHYATDSLWIAVDKTTYIKHTCYFTRHWHEWEEFINEAFLALLEFLRPGGTYMQVKKVGSRRGHLKWNKIVDQWEDWFAPTPWCVGVEGPAWSSCREQMTLPGTPSYLD